MFKGRPIIAICGPGAAGKDTVASILAESMNMKYVFSTSFGAAESFWRSINQGQQRHRGMLPGDYVDFNEFYRDRVNRRVAWADYISELNKNDPAGLYRYCLEAGNDFLIGIRKKSELVAVEHEGWVDLRIWVDAPDCPDETMEYGPEYCDISVYNPKTGIDNLRRKLLNFTLFHNYLNMRLTLVDSLKMNRRQLTERYLESLAKQDRADSGRPTQGNVSDAAC